MAICLPFEILIAIFEEVKDVRDLWIARRASRTLCAAATPFAFRVLSVVSTKGSAQNLGRLFDIPDIAAHVREISYRDTGTDRKGRTLKYVRSRAIHELATSFSRIHQLPRLETINLMFYPNYGNQIDSDSDARLARVALQASIVGALAASFSICAPPKLRSLSLHNLRTSHLLSSPLESPPFQAVLTTLRRLQLSVLFDSASNPKTFFARWCHFWGVLCPRMILAPMRHLTELTLHSGGLVGASSGLSFTGLHFPRLSTLSLRRFVFEPSVGAEDFILQHGATLARLELLGCMLPIDPDRFSYSSTDLARDDGSNPTAFWERIWDLFAVELTALVALHVDERCSDRRWGHNGPVFRASTLTHDRCCSIRGGARRILRGGERRSTWDNGSATVVPHPAVARPGRTLCRALKFCALQPSAYVAALSPCSHLTPPASWATAPHMSCREHQSVTLFGNLLLAPRLQ